MVLLRTDKEVALNDLLVAIEKTIDHYRDAADILNAPEINGVLRNLADERERFIPRLQEAIRALGDLPSMPDPDRETGEKILHHLGAEVSADYTQETLEQRIAAEQDLAALVDNARAAGADDALLTEIAQSVIAATKQLKAFYHQTSAS